MQGLFSTPIPPRDAVVRWSAREVVLDLFDVPHLMMRLTITGARVQVPSPNQVVTIGPLRSRMVRVANEGMRVDAYFDIDCAADGEIRLQMDGQTMLIVPDAFVAGNVQPLDRSRLPEGTRMRLAESATV